MKNIQKKNLKPNKKIRFPYPSPPEATSTLPKPFGGNLYISFKTILFLKYMHIYINHWDHMCIQV